MNGAIVFGDGVDDGLAGDGLAGWWFAELSHHICFLLSLPHRHNSSGELNPPERRPILIQGLGSEWSAMSFLRNILGQKSAESPLPSEDSGKLNTGFQSIDAAADQAIYCRFRRLCGGAVAFTSLDPDRWFVSTSAAYGNKRRPGSIHQMVPGVGTCPAIGLQERAGAAPVLDLGHPRTCLGHKDQ